MVDARAMQRLIIQNLSEISSGENCQNRGYDAKDGDNARLPRHTFQETPCRSLTAEE